MAFHNEERYYRILMVPVSLCCQFAFVMIGLCLQADTTDTEYRQPGGGIHQNQSVITSTVEGRYCTP